MIICAGSLLILTFVMMKFLHVSPCDAGLTSSAPAAEVSLKGKTQFCKEIIESFR